MKERPILFNEFSVKAILEGKKTQTRRVVKDPRRGSKYGHLFMMSGKPSIGDIQYELEHPEKPNFPCPYGQVGDRLWIRETWMPFGFFGDNGIFVHYKADGQERPLIVSLSHNLEPDTIGKWRPSIFMPRWASRITLEITGIRVERLQEISWEDTHAGGILRFDAAHPDPINSGIGYNRGTLGLPMRYESIAAYMDLWDSINGKKYPWSSNPWVWVLEFKRLQ